MLDFSTTEENGATYTRQKHHSDDFSVFLKTKVNTGVLCDILGFNGCENEYCGLHECEACFGG